MLPTHCADSASRYGASQYGQYSRLGTPHPCHLLSLLLLSIYSPNPTDHNQGSSYFFACTILAGCSSTDKENSAHKPRLCTPFVSRCFPVLCEGIPESGFARFVRVHSLLMIYMPPSLDPCRLLLLIIQQNTENSIRGQSYCAV